MKWRCRVGVKLERVEGKVCLNTRGDAIRYTMDDCRNINSSTTSQLPRSRPLPSVAWYGGKCFLLLRLCCFSHSPISPSFVTLALTRIPKWTTQCADHWTPIIFPTNSMREENCSIHGEHKITTTDYGTIPAGPSTLVSLFLH